MDAIAHILPQNNTVLPLPAHSKGDNKVPFLPPTARMEANQSLETLGHATFSSDAGSSTNYDPNFEVCSTPPSVELFWVTDEDLRGYDDKRFHARLRRAIPVLCKVTRRTVGRALRSMRNKLACL